MKVLKICLFLFGGQTFVLRGTVPQEPSMQVLVDRPENQKKFLEIESRLQEKGLLQRQSSSAGSSKLGSDGRSLGKGSDSGAGQPPVSCLLPPASCLLPPAKKHPPFPQGQTRAAS